MFGCLRGSAQQRPPLFSRHGRVCRLEPERSLLKRVEVEWIDSVQVCNGWENAGRLRLDLWADISPGMKVVSVGWLFADEPDYIVVMLSEGDDQVAEGVKIPRVAITNIYELRRK